VALIIYCISSSSKTVDLYARKKLTRGFAPRNPNNSHGCFYVHHLELGFPGGYWCPNKGNVCWVNWRGATPTQSSQFAQLLTCLLQEWHSSQRRGQTFSKHVVFHTAHIWNRRIEEI